MTVVPAMAWCLVCYRCGDPETTRTGEMKVEPGPRRVMAASEIAARVSELKPRFLEGIAPSDLAVIVGQATQRRFAAHTIIASEGHPAEKMFLIVEGRARTFTTTAKGVKVVLLWVAPGEFSGGRAMLTVPTTYLVNTETVTEVSALVWNRSAMLLLTKQFPTLLENALMIASDYVEAYRDLHVTASFYTAGQRVAMVLESLARGMGRRGFEGTELNVSNEELANEANVTIFTVSRLLSKWQRDGLLVKSRGRVIVRAPEELLRKAG
jgi:CRP-like cAMP-binding protein